MNNKSSEKTPENSVQDVKVSQHAARYLFVGIILTAFNYGFYTLLSNVIINNNGFIWLSTFISTVATTILAYILHSKITWKERQVTKHSIIRFFIWNAILAVAIGPWITQLFSLLTPLYEFVYHIFETIHIPFSYEFTLTTGAFVFASIVTLILNYLFYDKFVFDKPNYNKQKNK